jgi:hypothetical protein
MIKFLGAFVLSVLSVTAQSNVHAIGATFDTGDVNLELTPGKVIYYAIPLSCTVQGWDLTVDSGSVSIDVWRTHNGETLPTVSNSIVGQSMPSVALGGHHVHSSTLTGWQPNLTAHDILAFSLKESLGVSQASLVLQCQ